MLFISFRKIIFSYISTHYIAGAMHTLQCQYKLASSMVFLTVFIQVDNQLYIFVHNFCLFLTDFNNRIRLFFLMFHITQNFFLSKLNLNNFIQKPVLTVWSHLNCIKVWLIVFELSLIMHITLTSITYINELSSYCFEVGFIMSKCWLLDTA